MTNNIGFDNIATVEVRLKVGKWVEMTLRMYKSLLGSVDFPSVLRTRKCLIIIGEEKFQLTILNPISCHNDNAFNQLLIYNIVANYVKDDSK